MRNLIVDIGSGHKPHNNVDLCLELKDASKDHRWKKEIKKDRTVVLYDGNFFPFKNKCFDFSICSHVLEHVDNPKIFLEEISRISKKGYIETPNEISEQLFTPYDKHKWVIYERNNKLFIRKKIQENESKFGKLFDFLIDNEKKFRKRFYLNHKQLFLTRYSWSDKVDFEIIPENKNISINLSDDKILGSLTKIESPKLFHGFISSIKGKIKRKILPLNLEKLLICPKCKANVKIYKDKVQCNHCIITYKRHKNIIDMT